MTLSDRSVRRLLQRSFRCTWIHTGDDEAAGSSVAHEPGDAAGSCIRGNGEHNVQLLLLTPDGQVVSGLAGYLDAEAMVEELEFALDAWERARDEEEPAALLAELHQARAAELAKREWDGPLGDWEKRRALSDHRWSARRALIDVEDFRIVDMVGNARTFFSTTRGGGDRPTIGGGQGQPPRPPRTGR